MRHRRIKILHRLYSRWRWISSLVLLGAIALALVVCALLFIASRFGLEPAAFVLAGLAGLAILVLYAGILGVV